MDSKSVLVLMLVFLNLSWNHFSEGSPVSRSRRSFHLKNSLNSLARHRIAHKHTKKGLSGLDSAMLEAMIVPNVDLTPVRATSLLENELKGIIAPLRARDRDTSSDAIIVTAKSPEMDMNPPTQATSILNPHPASVQAPPPAAPSMPDEDLLNEEEGGCGKPDIQAEQVVDSEESEEDESPETENEEEEYSSSESDSESYESDSSDSDSHESDSSDSDSYESDSSESDSDSSDCDTYEYDIFGSYEYDSSSSSDSDSYERKEALKMKHKKRHGKSRKLHTKA